MHSHRNVPAASIRCAKALFCVGTAPGLTSQLLPSNNGLHCLAAAPLRLPLPACPPLRLPLSACPSPLASLRLPRCACPLRRYGGALEDDSGQLPSISEAITGTKSASGSEKLR